MGWCSATDIMDAAVGAADKLVAATYEALGVDPDRVTLADIQPELDEAMKPFVRTIAAKLRDGDWDCIEESDYFERFRAEMLGHDDVAHAAWIREQLNDAVTYGENDDVIRWAELLKAHTEKMKAGNS